MRPRLSATVVLALGAGLANVLSRQPRAAEWVTGWLELATLVLAIAAGLSLAEWSSDRWVERVRAYRQALAISERAALLERISRMDAVQIEFAKHYTPVIELSAAEDGPVMWLRVAAGTIPMAFIEEFIGASEGNFLCPIRRFAEGTPEREWAERFTSWAIWQGWASEAAGNRPARWVDQARALHAMGLE